MTLLKNKFVSTVAGTALSVAGALGMANSAYSDDATNVTGRPGTESRQELSMLDRAQGDELLQMMYAMYPPEQRDGYTYIRMDHLPDHPDASTLNVTEMEIAHNNPNRDDNPVIITNFSYEGFAKSDAQQALLERGMANLAKRAPNGLVYIDVKALDTDGNAPFLPALIAAIDENTLGHDGEHIARAEGKIIAPYGRVEHNGRELYDFSYAVFSDKVSERDVQLTIGTNIIGAIERSKDDVLVSQIPESQNPSLARNLE